MGEVNITINGRSFKLGCDDGEEQHLLELAGHLGKHVENLRQTLGKTGDEQLFLMAGLMVCDELWDARDQLNKREDELKQANNTPPAVMASPRGKPAPSGAPSPLTVGQKIAAGQKTVATQTRPAAAPAPLFPQNSDPKAS